ncbi:protein Z, vitamin K-dependent plasma glycoprotein b [Xenentodon cancila]
MSASLFALCLLACFLQVFGQGEVFPRAPGAQAVFLRSRRANQFLLEEILQGNLERECYEERCNFEEAREVFEDTDKTIAFWTRYYDGDQCEPNPCLNGGNCTDKVGGYSCSCSPPHYGAVCEKGALEVLEKAEKAEQLLPVRPNTAPVSECPTRGPTACHQLCTASQRSFTCSCMSGFKLHSDGRSCLPEVKFPCGRLPGAPALACHQGKCPWQVSLLNSRRVELCGGVVLGQRSVLTSARCLLLDSGPDLQPSNFYVLIGDNALFPVVALFPHSHFQMDHHDNDLALLKLAGPLPFSPTLIHLCLPTRDFSENILTQSGRVGVAGGSGELVYTPLDECRGELDVRHPLSNKMLCIRRKNGPAGIPNGAGGTGGVPSESPDGLLGDRNQTWGGLDRLTTNGIQNQTQNTQNRILTGAEPFYSTSPPMWRCGGLSPGSPVATVEKGTAFLTGLLMSSSASCDGQVFTKVSRYLNWIRPRLQVAEDHMTPPGQPVPRDPLTSGAN